MSTPTNFINEYGLTPKENLFVQEYIKCFDGFEAYRKAGFKAKNPTDCVKKLLDKPIVKAAINNMSQKLAAKNELSVDRVLEEYQAIAYSQIHDFMTLVDGELVIDLEKVGPDSRAARAIDTISQDEAVTRDGPTVVKRKVTRHDKMKALDFLAKFLGMDQPTRIEVSGPDGKPIQVRQDIDYSALSIEELEALYLMAQKVEGAARS